ncbi:hypothetical protein JCM19237_5834 [Photobacterium aphoticum]|uniref:Uncharacterized protein n=1 Tax=Photobacterium aphoticum TaxID=754436 RepID=A0A090QJ48_9GAMM|nr:hypothetical protein JCM19237_5834 [Photobacterium aphoticum]
MIKGNRYNIARCSRAPGWDCIASFEADNMAAIIKECGYKLEQWRKPINRRLKRLEKQRDQTIKAKAIAKQGKKPAQEINKLTSRIVRLEHQMKAQRDHLKSREAYANTKNVFCFWLEGLNAEQKAYDFLLWAAGARGWSMVPITEDTEKITEFDEIRNTARHEYADNFERFQTRRAYWQSVLNDPLVHSMVEPTEEEYIAHMIEREDYQKSQHEGRTLNGRIETNHRATER